jgi:hypothetical protein
VSVFFFNGRDSDCIKFTTQPQSFIITVIFITNNVTKVNTGPMDSFVIYLHQNEQGIAFRIEWYMFIRYYTSDMWHCKFWLTQENLGAMKYEDRGFGMVQCPKI